MSLLHVAVRALAIDIKDTEIAGGFRLARLAAMGKCGKGGGIIATLIGREAPFVIGLVVIGEGRASEKEEEPGGPPSESRRPGAKSRSYSFPKTKPQSSPVYLASAGSFDEFRASR